MPNQDGLRATSFSSGPGLDPEDMSAVDFSDQALQVHLIQADAQLPGADYYQVLRWIHNAILPDTYIEIGVREGASLRAARPETLCIGIDPAAQTTLPVGSNVQLFALTSDLFFANHTSGVLSKQGHFDLAFIDGLHLFEQALRDFINLERYATPRSVVMIHDCLPLDAVTSSRTRRTQFYSGDTWKLVPALIAYRPDLRVRIIATPPTGLCLVSNCDRESTVLERRYDEIVNTYLPLTFDQYLTLRSSFPALVENSPQAVSQCVSALRTSAER